eukprot:g1586.t1
MALEEDSIDKGIYVMKEEEKELEKNAAMQHAASFDSFSVFDAICEDMSRQTHDMPGGVAFEVLAVKDDEKGEEAKIVEATETGIGTSKASMPAPPTAVEKSKEDAGPSTSSTFEDSCEKDKTAAAPSSGKLTLAERYASVRFKLRRKMLIKEKKERMKGEKKNIEMKERKFGRERLSSAARSRQLPVKERQRVRRRRVPRDHIRQRRTVLTRNAENMPPKNTNKGRGKHRWLGPPRSNPTRTCVLGIVDGVGLTWKKLGSRSSSERARYRVPSRGRTKNTRLYGGYGALDRERRRRHKMRMKQERSALLHAQVRQRRAEVRRYKHDSDARRNRQFLNRRKKKSSDGEAWFQSRVTEKSKTQDGRNVMKHRGIYASAGGDNARENALVHQLRLAAVEKASSGRIPLHMAHQQYPRSDLRDADARELQQRTAAAAALGKDHAEYYSQYNDQQYHNDTPYNEHNASHSSIAAQRIVEVPMDAAHQHRRSDDKDAPREVNVRDQLSVEHRLIAAVERLRREQEKSDIDSHIQRNMSGEISAERSEDVDGEKTVADDNSSKKVSKAKEIDEEEEDDEVDVSAQWSAPTRSERGIDIPPLRLVAANIQANSSTATATAVASKASNDVEAPAPLNDRSRHRSSSSSDVATSSGADAVCAENAKNGEAAEDKSAVLFKGLEGKGDAAKTEFEAVEERGSTSAIRREPTMTTDTVAASEMKNDQRHDRPTMQIAALNKTRASKICRRLLMLASQPEQGESPVRTPSGSELWDLPSEHPAFIASAELLRLQTFNARRHYELRRALKVVHPEAVRHQLLHENGEELGLGHRMLFYGDRLSALTSAVREGFHCVSPSGLLVFSTDVAIADRIREQLSRQHREESGHHPSHSGADASNGHHHHSSHKKRQARSIWRVLLVAVSTGRSFRSPVPLSDFASSSRAAHEALQDFVAEGWQTLQFEGPDPQEQTFLCQQTVKHGLMGNEPFVPCYLLEYISD